MTHSTSDVSPITVGLDVGDRITHFCAGSDRKVIASGRFSTTKDALLREQDLACFPETKLTARSRRLRRA